MYGGSMDRVRPRLIWADGWTRREVTEKGSQKHSGSLIWPSTPTLKSLRKSYPDTRAERERDLPNDNMINSPLSSAINFWVLSLYIYVRTRGWQFSFSFFASVLYMCDWALYRENYSGQNVINKTSGSIRRKWDFKGKPLMDQIHPRTPQGDPVSQSDFLLETRHGSGEWWDEEDINVPIFPFFGWNSRPEYEMRIHAFAMIQTIICKL